MYFSKNLYWHIWLPDGLLDSFEALGNGCDPPKNLKKKLEVWKEAFVKSFVIQNGSRSNKC